MQWLSTNMNNIKGCLMHNSDHWSTPSNLYNAFMINGFIDPCPLHCTEDNLQKYFENSKLFVYPPSSQLKVWVDWCIKQYFNGCEIFLLLPSRTDTQYFSRILDMLPDFYFIKGRLHFNDSKLGAPFPTVIVHFFHDKERTLQRCCSITLNDFISALYW